jgi:hypothetical protein
MKDGDDVVDAGVFPQIQAIENRGQSLEDVYWSGYWSEFVVMLGRRFVARTEAIILQADEVADVEYFRGQFGVRILLLLLLRDGERVSGVVAGVLERLGKGFCGFRALARWQARSEMPRGGTV